MLTMPFKHRPGKRALPACIWPSPRSAVAEVEQPRARFLSDSPPPPPSVSWRGAAEGGATRLTGLNGEINNKSLV